VNKDLYSAVIGPDSEVTHVDRNNAPAHTTREIEKLLTHETPDVIVPILWPANNPDPNPLDYRIWAKLHRV